MECELLKSAKREAKKNGFDPRAVYCPPDQRAICTQTSCSILPDDPDDMIEGGANLPSPVDIFYGKLEKHVLLVSPQS